MNAISQNVIKQSSPKYHSLRAECGADIADNIAMRDSDKNGGPNHLRAWRLRREMTLEELANKVGTNSNVIGYLETGERGLSAKWLRRLAPPLGLTPGLLLDHHPDTLSDDMIDMWVDANQEQRRQITDMAKIILKKDGTNN